MRSIRFCFVLHNHQPVGNFDGVFEQAYRDAYLPFLNVFEPYQNLKVSLHTSGPLMEWLDQRHPEYLDRLARLVRAGRIEILGGAYYEAILTMIPARDRVGQIATYSRWLENRLGCTVRGMWMPERVWEQTLTADIASAGIQYTLLDDFHFKNAGLIDEQLHGYYITEENGQTLSVFPGSEPLRYTIPFQSPQQSIDYLRSLAERQPNAVAVFGDDGEKFGSWPNTNKHVYENGWLRQFFDALEANRDWIHVTTLGEVVENVAPLDKIYLPDGSYREMTEWALPVELQHEYEQVTQELANDARWPRIKRFVRGGFWRNFKVKYPEANDMYARMMMLSKKLGEAEAQGIDAETIRQARQALYRGQCNCPYWHGAFGGIYLPHLRNAIYNQLIAGDNLLDQAMRPQPTWCEATVDDYNFDARQEIRLAGDKLLALLAPAQGGQIYELDVRSICLNLGASMTRRPEVYHRRILAGSNGSGKIASIQEGMVFKQAGLDQKLQYDSHPRTSLLDHFYSPEATVASIAAGQAEEQGDFLRGVYEAKVRRASDRVQVQLSREGLVQGHTVRLTKAVTLSAGSNVLEFAYLLENLPADKLFHLAVEFNFAALPSGADNRYFHSHDKRWGHLGSQLDLRDVRELGLNDEWLGIDVQLSSERSMNIWTFPIESVSQSEGGFELVHQSVAVLPHWLVRADANGCWSVTFQIAADTTLAESRMGSAQHERHEVVVGV
jgi:4-alpha-glucanotransferase